MSRGVKVTFLVVTGLLLAALAGWWLLPRAVAALPGRVRVYLPHQLVQMVTTPLPTALPAPRLAATVEPVALLLPSPTATATPTITPTPPQTAESVLQPTAVPSPTATPTPALPATVRLEGLTIAPQKLNNCGPTNLSINLAFYGLETDQFDVAAVVKPNYEDRNVSPEELVTYVNEQTGLKAAVFRGGDRSTLQRLLAAGYPVVVEKGLEPSEWEGWMGHYLTLFGYDEAQREFYSLDTLLGPWDGSGRVDSYETIDHYWQHFNYTFFVVYPPEEETAVQTLLPTALLEPLSMWSHAAQQAQTEIERDPEDAFAWFNLGSSLTEVARLTDDQPLYQRAAAAFDRARQLGLPPRLLWYQFWPYDAYLAAGRTDDVLLLTETTLNNQGGRNVEETYLYRGHARLAADDPAGAAVDYRRALALQPAFAAAQQALAALPNN